MKTSIQAVFDFDSEIHELFENVGNRFVPHLGDSDYSITYMSLMGLMASSNSIKLGIYDLAEESTTHLYAIKILHRALIDHYLKFYYIFFRLLEEKSDDVGKEYRLYSEISETLDLISAGSAALKIAGKSDEEAILMELKKADPRLDVSKKLINEITQKWKHRSIVRFIKNNTSVISGDESYILKLIPKYAELSSFVHGGTHAEKYMAGAMAGNDIDELSLDCVFEASIMSSTMKAHMLIAVSLMDKRAIDDYSLLMNRTRKFLSDCE